MAGVFDKMRWRGFPIGVTSAFGTSELLLGEFGGGEPGMLITAGLHGDEGPWGGWAIRKMLERVEADDVHGFIRVVPMTNPLAMQVDKRNAPVDQLDMNRVFPGNARGSYSERAAHVLATEGLQGIDYVIDLHGGGSWCVNDFVFEMEGGRELSLAFPASFIVKREADADSLAGYAKSLGRTVAAVELGGRSQFEGAGADKIADGLLRALCKVGIVDERKAPPPIDPPLAVSGTDVLRPGSGGIFVPVLDASHIGTLVPKGTLLGRMLHPATFAVIEEFRAPFEQTALLLLRPFVAQLEAGAMTYVISQPV